MPPRCLPRLGSLVLTLGGSVSGCTNHLPLHVAPAWPGGSEAVVIALLDQDDRPVEGSPWMGEPVEIQVPADAFPVRLFARSYEAASLGGPDLEACPLGHGGAGWRPAPKHAWTSGGISDEAGAVRFEPEPEPRLELDLRLQGDCARSLCERTEIDTYTLQGGPEEAMDINVVAALSAERALLFGDHAYVPYLFALSAATGIESLSAAALATEVDEGSSDRALGALVRCADGSVRQLNERGERSRDIAAAFPIVHLTIGIDGSSFVSSQEIVGAVSASSSVAAPLAVQPRSPILKLHAVSRTRMISVSTKGIDYYDGTRWREELSVPIEDSKGNRIAIAGDELVYYLQDDSGPRIRNEETGQWESGPVPLTTSVPRTAVGLGGGRLLAGGQTGGLALYEHGAWCDLPTRTSAALIGSDVSPDRRAAFVSSWQDEETTWIFHLKLP